jgi:hypothetical protein
MNDKFDELAKAMAQPVARRTALKRLGVGLVGTALAALGVENAMAASGTKKKCCIYETPYRQRIPICVDPGVNCPPAGAIITGSVLVSEKMVRDCEACAREARPPRILG